MKLLPQRNSSKPSNSYRSNSNENNAKRQMNQHAVTQSEFHLKPQVSGYYLNQDYTSRFKSVKSSVSTIMNSVQKSHDIQNDSLFQLNQQTQKKHRYFHNIAVLIGSIKSNDFQNIINQKITKELLQSSLSILCFLAGSIKQIGLDYLYKKYNDWTQIRQMFVLHFSKIQNIILNIEELLQQDKIKKKNYLVAKQHFEVLGKFQVYDYHAIHVNDVQFNKRIVDLAYYLITYFEQFHQLKEFKMKRLKSQGSFRKTQTYTQQKNGVNEATNTSTEENILKASDLDRELRDLETNIKRKQDALNQIRQQMVIQQRSKSQGDIMSPEKKRRIMEELQVKQVREHFKRQNKTRYFISPNKERIDSARSRSEEQTDRSINLQIKTEKKGNIFLQMRLSQPQNKISMGESGQFFKTLTQPEKNIRESQSRGLFQGTLNKINKSKDNDKNRISQDFISKTRSFKSEYMKTQIQSKNKLPLKNYR